MRNIINARRKWKYSEHPELMPHRYNKRKEHHTPATKFSEMSEENKSVFIAITKKVIALNAKITCYAFGSRMKGRWSDKSDYDVIVVGSSPEEKELIKKMQFSVRVDFKFHADPPSNKYAIKITDEKE